MLLEQTYEPRLASEGHSKALTSGVKNFGSQNAKHKLGPVWNIFDGQHCAFGAASAHVDHSCPLISGLPDLDNNFRKYRRPCEYLDTFANLAHRSL